MRDRLVRRAVKHRFLVTTDSEEAFSGVLTDASEEFYVFAAVDVVGPKSERVPLDSELWIPRLRVKYMQVMAP